MLGKTWLGLEDKYISLLSIDAFALGVLVCFLASARKSGQNTEGKRMQISVAKYFCLPDPATFSRAWVHELTLVHMRSFCGKALSCNVRLFLCGFGLCFTFDMTSARVLMVSSEAAVWGIALICALETSARKQEARGDVDVCRVEKIFFSPRFARTDDA